MDSSATTNSSPLNGDDIPASANRLSENVMLLKSEIDALERRWGGEPLWEYGQPFSHFNPHLHPLYWFGKFLSHDQDTMSTVVELRSSGDVIAFGLRP